MTKQTTSKPKKTIHATRDKAINAATWKVRQDKGDGWSLVNDHVYNNGAGCEVMSVLRFEPSDGSDKTFVPIHPFWC